MKISKKDWLNIFFIWTVITVLYSAQSYIYRSNIGQNVNWFGLFIKDLPYFYLWAILTPLLTKIVIRIKVSKRNWYKTIPIHAAVAILFGFFTRTVYNIILFLHNTDLEFTSDRLFMGTLGSFDYDIIIYVAVIFVIHSILYYQELQGSKLKTAQLNEALSQARLLSLKMQFHPHFLFNTLNTISILQKEKPEEASNTVEYLSDLLRYSLNISEEQFHKVEEELDFITKYLEIEKIRFSDRLQVEIKNEVNSYTKIPALLLQPIIENSIKHGIAKDITASKILVHLFELNGKLRIQVEDNGPGLPDKFKIETDLRVGLGNTISRLKSLYENNYEFNIIDHQPKGTVVEISIPLEEY